MTELNIPQPWNDEPYWINPENGIEWVIDKHTTSYCTEYLYGWAKLNAICFFVVKNENGKRQPLSRILIDVETNEVLADTT